MQSEFGNFTEKPPIFYNYETGGYAQNVPNLEGTNPNPNFACAPTEYKFEPFENCPKSLIIFDQTNSKSHVMCHPHLVQKFGLENYYLNSPIADMDCRSGNICNSSSFKEDSNEIDILLNSDYEEGFDDDTVSTSRSPQNQEMISWNSESGNSIPGFCDSNFENKREKTRNLVRSLRKIIPGGEELDTGTVLDEAVKYLKYLKMETKRLGITSFD